MTGATCPLCAMPESVPLPPAHGRRMHDCRRCRLVFVDRSELPTAADEKARYDTHRNDPADEGYRTFLAPALRAVQARLPVGAEGLDYGAGPGPALAQMLTEAGYPTSLHDPFYHPDEHVLARKWDFVVCTETAEHFHEPARDFAQLAALLKGPGSHLVIMTQLLDEGVELGSWWYARDPTHVAFYRPVTLAWIAGTFGWKLTRPEPGVAVFSPQPAGAPTGQPRPD